MAKAYATCNVSRCCYSTHTHVPCHCTSQALHLFAPTILTHHTRLPLPPTTLTHHTRPPHSPTTLTHHTHPLLPPTTLTHQTHPPPTTLTHHTHHYYPPHSPTTTTHHTHSPHSPTTTTHHTHPPLPPLRYTFYVHTYKWLAVIVFAPLWSANSAVPVNTFSRNNSTARAASSQENSFIPTPLTRQAQPSLPETGINRKESEMGRTGDGDEGFGRSVLQNGQCWQMSGRRTCYAHSTIPYVCMYVHTMESLSALW